MKRYIAIVTLLTALILSATAQAGPFSRGGEGMRQGPPGAELWGLAQRLEQVADDVGISDDQLDQIHALLDASRDDMRALGRSMRDNHRAIRDASEVDDYDPDQVASLAAEQGRLTEQMIILGTRLRVDIASVLSEEQRERLHALRDQRRGR